MAKQNILLFMLNTIGKLISALKSQKIDQKTINDFLLFVFGALSSSIFIALQQTKYKKLSSFKRDNEKFVRTIPPSSRRRKCHPF